MRVNLADPVSVATIPTPGPAGPVDVEGDLAAFASSAVGLRLVDVSDLANPIDLATWRSSGTVSEVDLVGTLAYVSENTLGLGVIDVSDPAAPAEVGRFAAGGATVRSFVVEGPLGYLATNNAPCLRVLNLANPAQPVEIGSLEEQAIPTQVAVAGERAFLTVGENGLLVVNIGNPQAPFVAQRLVTGGNATLVAVAGGLAFVITTETDGFDVDSRLLIYDTSGDRVTYVSDLLLEEWV